eukprot:4483466-Prymnesium_polylepis.1
MAKWRRSGQRAGGLEGDRWRAVEGRTGSSRGKRVAVLGLWRCARRSLAACGATLARGAVGGMAVAHRR